MSYLVSFCHTNYYPQTSHSSRDDFFFCVKLLVSTFDNTGLRGKLCCTVINCDVACFSVKMLFLLLFLKFQHTSLFPPIRLTLHTQQRKQLIVTDFTFVPIIRTHYCCLIKSDGEKDRFRPLFRYEVDVLFEDMVLMLINLIPTMMLILFTHLYIAKKKTDFKGINR